MAFREKEVAKCTLFDWVKEHRSEEELREVFLNMDIALKYIHDHGYCISVFHPSAIQVLYDRPDYIQFDHLIELSQNPIAKKNMIKEDIFNSSLIQIGLYTNTLKQITPKTLRDNFDDFSRFLPEGDVPYYRGIVQRGASVYFNEFALERMNRDLEQLDKQIQESEGGRPLQKTNGHFESEPLSNDRINDDIYKQINGLRDSAFISYLLVPTVVFISLFLMAFVSWIISFF